MASMRSKSFGERIADVLIEDGLLLPNQLEPIARLNGKLFVAMADPTNVLAVDDLKRRVQLEIVPMIATERSVSDALAGVHGGANMSQVLRQVSEEAAQTAE